MGLGLVQTFWSRGESVAPAGIQTPDYPSHVVVIILTMLFHTWLYVTEFIGVVSHSLQLMVTLCTTCFNIKSCIVLVECIYGLFEILGVNSSYILHSIKQLSFVMVAQCAFFDMRNKLRRWVWGFTGFTLLLILWCQTVHICNTQCDTQNAQRHRSISPHMRSPRKFWFPADHNRQLILVWKG